MDWIRTFDILSCWIWICVEWVFMGSGRFWHSAFDSDIAGWNYMDWQNRNIDIPNFWSWSCVEWFFICSGRLGHSAYYSDIP